MLLLTLGFGVLAAKPERWVTPVIVRVVGRALDAFLVDAVRVIIAALAGRDVAGLPVPVCAETMGTGTAAAIADDASAAASVRRSEGF